MNDIERKARELLAAEYEKGQFRAYGPEIRSGKAGSTWDEEVRAIIAALTPPEGYVLVPVEPTDEMLSTGYGWMMGPSVMRKLWKQLLAACPEVK